jgi:hypothetical protein
MYYVLATDFLNMFKILFKNLKTILKRKGSKTKKNKRSVSISQSPAQEVTVKKHFERYDMS